MKQIPMGTVHLAIPVCLFMVVLQACAIPATGESQPQERSSGEGFVAAVPNHVTIYSPDKIRKPVTVSRVFAQGEFSNSVAAALDSKPVPTQCDVMNRWPDGTIKHAIVHFWMENGSSKGVQVSFIPAPPVGEAGYLEGNEMLSGDYDFGARMILGRPDGDKVIDARTMLSEGNFRYRMKGPIATQVIIEDQSLTMKYDVAGGSAEGQFHPIFVATFYRGWRGVRVESIGENAWTTHLGALTYDLSILTGPPSQPKTVYTKKSFTQYSRTRWRRVFWSGPEAQITRIDFNLPYLIYTRVIPNYDLDIDLPKSAINDEVSAFNSTDKGDLGGSGEWMKYFPTTGGRPDIGLFPRWAVRYLYSFSSELHTILISNGEVSGYIPIHFRESDDTRKFLSDDNTNALGKVLSLNARPTVWAARLGWEETTAADQIDAPPDNDASGWTPDLAHQGSFAYLPYLFTGDWYFLEELYFWSAYNVASTWPAVEENFGRHSDWGYISHSVQTRGVAWGLRTVGETAFIAPDDTPEKRYFNQKMQVNIAVREGALNIKDGNFYDPTPGSYWEWGWRFVGEKRDNALHYMDSWDNYASLDGMDTDTSNPCRASRVNSPWMQNYEHIVMGHLEELGFPLEKVREKIALNLIGQIMSPDYNPYLVGAYRIPAFRASDDTFYQSWACVLQAYVPEMRKLKSWQGSENDAEHGFAVIAKSALSFMPGITDPEKGYKGVDAWEWAVQNIEMNDAVRSNPKWAFVPREQATAAGSRRSSPRRGNRR